MSLIIGIDPGVHTGFAVYNDLPSVKALTTVMSLKIHQAMREVERMFNAGSDILVVVEDARLRKWYGNHDAKKDRSKLQGAGSIKRDCSIWQDFLSELGCEYEMVAPKSSSTKMSSEMFNKVTGWKGRTNEHGRDAALKVFGRSKNKNNFRNTCARHS